MGRAGVRWGGGQGWGGRKEGGTSRVGHSLRTRRETWRRRVRKAGGGRRGTAFATMQTGEQRPVQTLLGQERDQRFPSTDALAPLPPHPRRGPSGGRGSPGQRGLVEGAPESARRAGAAGEPPGQPGEPGEPPVDRRCPGRPGGDGAPGRTPGRADGSFRAAHPSPPRPQRPPPAPRPRRYLRRRFFHRFLRPPHRRGSLPRSGAPSWLFPLLLPALLWSPVARSLTPSLATAEAANRVVKTLHNRLYL